MAAANAGDVIVIVQCLMLSQLYYGLEDVMPAVSLAVRAMRANRARTATAIALSGRQHISYRGAYVIPMAYYGSILVSQSW